MKHIKLFKEGVRHENQEISFDEWSDLKLFDSFYWKEISEDEYLDRTCKSQFGNQHDSELLRNVELFTKPEIDRLDNLPYSDIVDQHFYHKYKTMKVGVEDNSEFQDYYRIDLKLQLVGSEVSYESYLINKRSDDWFYVRYDAIRMRDSRHWECDQFDGLLKLLKDLKLID